MKGEQDPMASDMAVIVGRHIMAFGLWLVVGVWTWQLWHGGGNSRAQDALIRALGDWPAYFMTLVWLVLTVGQARRLFKALGGFLVSAATLTMAGASFLAGLPDIAVSLVGLTALAFGFALIAAGGMGK